MFFSVYNDKVDTDSSKEVKEVEVRLVAENFKGEVNITDVMCQGGAISTNWAGHPSEKRWHDN